MKNIIVSKLTETTEFIKERTKITPEIGIVLGSGLGPLAETIVDPVKIPYEKIPHFAKSTVEGHAGELVFGSLNDRSVVCMKGRFHYYEGYSMWDITYPIKLFKALGVKILLLTNAAGGINKSFSPGNLMIITDHINFLGKNPLMGPNDNTLGPRFPDMSHTYSERIREISKKIAQSMKFDLKEGVYVATTGPTYETPAEIRMFRTLGADAVGMSTVPEAIVANHMELEIFALSCITNMAAGVLNQKLSHSEVTETANEVKKTFIKLIQKLVNEI